MSQKDTAPSARCDLKPFLGLLAVDVLGFTLVSSESLNFSQDTSKIYKYSNKFYFILHHHLLLWYFFVFNDFLIRRAFVVRFEHVGYLLSGAFRFVFLTLSHQR